MVDVRSFLIGGQLLLVGRMGQVDLDSLPLQTGPDLGLATADVLLLAGSVALAVVVALAARRRGRFATLYGLAVLTAVGVAGLPCFLGDHDRDLVRINDGVPSFARDIWLLVHRDLRKNPAVRAVMDFVAQAISENRDLALR